MKTRTKIVWGSGLILAGILLLLNSLGVTMGLPEGVTLWELVLATLCLAWAANELVRGRIPGVFLPLCGIYTIFNDEIATALGLPEPVSIWLILAIAILLTAGTAILVPRSWYKKKIKAEVKKRVGGEQSQPQEHKMKNICYVDCSTSFSETIENNLGQTDVYFANVAMYQGGGVIVAENNLGRLVIHLPKGWLIDAKIQNNLGGVSMPDMDLSSSAPVIKLIGENNLGSIEVVIHGG